MTDHQGTGKIAYLTGEYPKVSHTFIFREIAALEALGLTVLPCTIRRPPPETVVGADQQAEAARTFGVIAAGKNPLRLVADHAALLRQSPRRWLSALRLAWRTRAPGARAHLWQLFYFLEAAVLARHLQRQGATHLHNHFADPSCTVAMLASEMSGIPFSFTEHGPNIFFDAPRWRLDEKIARAARVVAISHFCRSQLMLFSGPAHWDKIAIVHCGVDPARYRRRKDSRGKAILFVGRLDPVKGGPLLLEAFGRIRAEHPDATLSVIGDGAERPALEAAARAFGGAVTFHGYLPQDDVARHLGRADMLVLPSFAEGVPVVLMEAMASQIPVIASRVAGISELVEDGVSGFLVPPGDVDSLTARLDRLLSDPELCAAMGAAGRDVVAAEFDIAAEAAWLAQVLNGQGPNGEGLAGLRPRDGHASATETSLESAAQTVQEQKDRRPAPEDTEIR